MERGIVEKIKNKPDIIDILEGVGAVFEGDRCTCPFHDDNSPSGGIFRDDKGHWRFRCFVCDITLDYYDIIAKREGLDIGDTLKMEPTKEREKHVYDNYYDCLGEYESKYSYYDKENLLLVTKIRMKADNAKGKTYRMVSPYYGGFIREGPQPPWPLYNIPGILKSGKNGIVVVEGEKCADALNEMGFIATTALTSTSVDQTDWTPLYGKTVVIWPDNDTPGAKYASAIERKLLPHCKVTKVVPDNLNLGPKEDVVDFIDKGNDSDKVRRVLIEASKNTPSAGVEQYIEGMIDGSIRAIEWPWPLLHRYSQALLPGTITVLVGPPGSAKSFMLMEALAYWVKNGIGVGLHVLEEDKTFHLLRALAQVSGVSQLAESDWVRANPEISRKAWLDNKDFLDTIGRHLYAQPDRQVNLDEIFSWMIEQLEAGCRIVVIDPITAASRSKNIWEADEEFILNSKKLADKYKASLIFVTHPKKDDASPYLGNIRGGAAYQQFVQNVFWIEKIGGNQCVELVDGSMVEANRLLHILKARNAREMETGVLAYFMKSGLTFSEQGEFRKIER